MAIAKSRTSIWSSQTLTAGAGNTNSGWLDLSGAYSAEVNFSLVNGGTGPTLPAQVQIQVGNDYNAGNPTLPVNYGGPMIAGNASSTTYNFSCEIPPGVASLRLVAGSNTGQNVTVNADISTVTAI